MSIAKDLESESNEWDDNITLLPDELLSDEPPLETDLHLWQMLLVRSTCIDRD